MTAIYQSNVCGVASSTHTVQLVLLTINRVLRCSHLMRTRLERDAPNVHSWREGGTSEHASDGAIPASVTWLQVEWRKRDILCP